MRFLAIGELPDTVTVERLQCRDARELDRPAVLGRQRQEFGRGGHGRHVVVGFRDGPTQVRLRPSRKVASAAPSGSNPLVI